MLVRWQVTWRSDRRLWPFGTWETIIGGAARPSDRFPINEFRVPRRRASFAPGLQAAYANAVNTTARAIDQPIHCAGEGE